MQRENKVTWGANSLLRDLALLLRANASSAIHWGKTVANGGDCSFRNTATFFENNHNSARCTETKCCVLHKLR
jgi:hypothetical protein